MRGRVLSGIRPHQPAKRKGMLSITRLFIDKEPGDNTRCHFGVEILNHGTESVEIRKTHPKAIGEPGALSPGERHQVRLSTFLEKEPIQFVRQQLTVSYEWSALSATQTGQISTRIIIPKPAD